MPRKRSKSSLSPLLRVSCFGEPPTSETRVSGFHSMPRSANAASKAFDVSGEELDALALLQVLAPCSLDAGGVDEQVSPTPHVRGDEPVALALAEPLDDPDRHALLLEPVPAPGGSVGVFTFHRWGLHAHPLRRA